MAEVDIIDLVRVGALNGGENVYFDGKGRGGDDVRVVLPHRVSRKADHLSLSSWLDRRARARYAPRRAGIHDNDVEPYRFWRPRNDGRF